MTPIIEWTGARWRCRNCSDGKKHFLDLPHKAFGWTLAQRYWSEVDPEAPAVIIVRSYGRQRIARQMKG